MLNTYTSSFSLKLVLSEFLCYFKQRRLFNLSQKLICKFLEINIILFDGFFGSTACHIVKLENYSFS